MYSPSYPKLKELDQSHTVDVFDDALDPFYDTLTAAGVPHKEFAEMLYYDYMDARIRFVTDPLISKCFQRVWYKNKKKYEVWLQVYAAEYDPIENYSRHEESTKTRTPDLTQQTDAQSERKQTRTTTENPDTYTDTETRSVSPYNSSIMSAAEQISRSASGSRNTTESYSGDPDTASSTTTTTGTDTESTESDISGNIGTTTSQQMLESSLDLSQRMRLVQEIEQDIAKELFLQIWI